MAFSLTVLQPGPPSVVETSETIVAVNITPLGHYNRQTSPSCQSGSYCQDLYLSSTGQLSDTNSMVENCNVLIVTPKQNRDMNTIKVLHTKLDICSILLCFYYLN